MSNSFFLFIMLLAFNYTHLSSALDVRSLNRNDQHETHWSRSTAQLACGSHNGNAGHECSRIETAGVLVRPPPRVFTAGGRPVCPEKYHGGCDEILLRCRGTRSNNCTHEYRRCLVASCRRQPSVLFAANNHSPPTSSNRAPRNARPRETDIFN